MPKTLDPHWFPKHLLRVPGVPDDAFPSRNDYFHLSGVTSSSRNHDFWLGVYVFPSLRGCLFRSHSTFPENPEKPLVSLVPHTVPGVPDDVSILENDYSHARGITFHPGNMISRPGCMFPSSPRACVSSTKRFSGKSWEPLISLVSCTVPGVPDVVVHPGNDHFHHRGMIFHPGIMISRPGFIFHRLGR